MEGTVLGLDLGVTSVGWALIQAEFDEDGRQTGENGILAMGVRIFEAGMDMTRGLSSRNVERRQARAARRMHQRRRKRKMKLRRILQEAKLLPDTEEQFAAVIALDPYELRAQALDQPLKPHELGRVFMHLGQRRGFKSNRKSERDAEHGKLLEQITALQQEMKECESRTLGEHLHKLREWNAAELLTGDFRLRKRHTSRAMYEQEFDLIWETQSQWVEQLRIPGLKERVREAIFFQRDFEVTDERRQKVLEYAKKARRARGLPDDRGIRRANLWRAPDVGKCPFEPDQPRCPKHDWVAQQFRIYKEVNNLRVIPADGSADRKLTENERKLIVQLLSTTREQKFQKLREKLKLERDRFNLEIGGREKIGGNTVEAAIASAFGKSTWRKMSDSKRDHIRKLVLEHPDEFELIEKLEAEGLSRDKAQKLATLQTGGALMRLSKKAMQKMLPFLEQGMDEYEAMQACGYEVKDDRRQVDKLPPTPDLPNPLVRRALVETRKVVNAILREYGRPTRIVVEMARDMTLVGKRREEHLRNQRALEKERDEAREYLRESFGLEYPSRSDIERYRLWKEQDGVCPYTGLAIDQSRLLSPDFEVDHILPRWRSMDDSYMNKVLVSAAANREKGDRTPYEWLHKDEARYRKVLGLVERSSMPPRKRQRFKLEELNESEAPERLLNDTRYMTREAVKYLNQLYPEEERVGEKSVGTSKGMMSAKLRYAWGIDNLVGHAQGGVGKARDDLRHHAIDALVTALTTRSRLKKFADYWRRTEPNYVSAKNMDVVFDTPWEEFRSDVIDKVDGINVSHRPQRKIRGALHEETFYGRTEEENEFVYTVPIESLTPSQLQSVRNPATRALIEQRLYEKGWQGGKTKFPKDWCEEALRFPSGQRLRKVRVLKALGNTVPFEDKDTGEVFRIAKLGGNHHLEVIRKEGTSGPDGLRFEAVSRWEAAHRARRLGISPYRMDHGDGWHTEMVLHRGDSVLMWDEDLQEDVLCVVQKVSTVPNVDVVLKLASDGRPGKESGQSPQARIVSARAWLKAKVRPVEVTPLGDLRESH